MQSKSGQCLWTTCLALATVKCRFKDYNSITVRFVFTGEPLESKSTPANFFRSMIQNSFNIRDNQRCQQTISNDEVFFHFVTVNQP